MKLEINNNLEQDSLDGNHYSVFSFKEKNLEEMLREGVNLAQQGERAKARHLLLSVTETEPDNETAWLWLASISEYPEELLIFLQNVLKINPENARAIEWAKETKSLLAKTFVHRGIDAFHQQQKDFARQCFLQAIVHEAENEMAWLWLASMTEAVEEKIIYLQKVLNFNPQNETALTSLNELKKQTIQAQLRKANSAAISGDKEAACAVLEEIMEDSPNLEEAWILKAYLSDGFYEKIQCYEKVLEINPQNEAAQAGISSLKILIEKAENQPVISQQIAGLQIEPQSPQNSSASSENTPEFPAAPLESSFQSDSYEIQPLNPSDAEESPELAEESHEFSNSNESAIDLETALPVDNDTENYLIDDTQIPNSEFSFKDNVFSGENYQNSTESEFTHSESPTQKLEEISTVKPQIASSSDSEEVELIETYFDETSSFSEFEKPDFSLEVEEESENYLIDDTQMPNSPYSDFSENSHRNFAAFNENAAKSFTTPEESAQIDDKNSADVYFVDYNQPTVELSYNKVSPAFNDQNSAQTFEKENSENYFHELPLNEESPVEENVQSEIFSSAVSETPETYFETHPQEPTVECPFCNFSNESQVICCVSCRTMLSLSDLEMLLAHQESDQKILAERIKLMEDEKAARSLTTDELFLLGLAYLNAKKLRKGLETLQEASKLNPNDVVLSSKVNFLAIRISEIELQENKHQEHASVSRVIMVVDDSATVRKLISGKLEKSGHSVVTAVDGIEALSKIAETVPDLILLDISMPQMDGYQVCKMIRSNEATKDVPVVMISGKDGFFDKVRGRMAGSTDYITKPFGPETLMKTVETYLN